MYDGNLIRLKYLIYRMSSNSFIIYEARKISIDVWLQPRHGESQSCGRVAAMKVMQNRLSRDSIEFATLSFRNHGNATVKFTCGPQFIIGIAHEMAGIYGWNRATSKIECKSARCSVAIPDHPLVNIWGIGGLNAAA